MDGQPVWLASVSRQELGRIQPVPRWSRAVRQESEALLRTTLERVGDPTRERWFRMNVTLCCHRAATDTEVASMPAWFTTHPAVALAGGPVEILTETVPGAASTRPCRAPRKFWLDAGDPLLWAPLDCGKCAPCLARSAVHSR